MSAALPPPPASSVPVRDRPLARSRAAGPVRPRRHVVPGLAVYVLFLCVSIAGRAKQLGPDDAPYDEEHALDCEGPDCPEPTKAFDGAPIPFVNEKYAEAYEEARAIANSAPPTPKPAPAPSPAPPDPPSAMPSDAAPERNAVRGLVIERLHAAQKALASAGRQPERVLLALQSARAELEAAEKELGRYRSSPLLGDQAEKARLFARAADRARGKLLRASLDLDSAVRRVLAGAPSGLEDPFAAPERLLEEARAQVALAAEAAAAAP